MGKSCGVQLSTQVLQVIETRGADTYVCKSPGGLREDFLTLQTLFKVSTKMLYKEKTYNLLSFHVYKCLSC
jgi:hypothetical protein